MPVDPKDDTALEALFADARAETAPSDDLIARVLADADAVQAGFAEPVAAPPAPTRGWFAEVIASLGGWAGASGVALAGVTGIMLGFYAPDIVDTWTGGQIWSVSGGAGVTPEIGSLWAEESDV